LLCPTVLLLPPFRAVWELRGGELGIWRALNNSDSWLFVSLVSSLPAVTNFDCAHVVTSRPSDGNGSEDSMQEISREPHTQKRSTQKRRTEELEEQCQSKRNNSMAAEPFGRTIKSTLPRLRLPSSKQCPFLALLTVELLWCLSSSCCTIPSRLKLEIRVQKGQGS